MIEKLMRLITEYQLCTVYHVYISERNSVLFAASYTVHDLDGKTRWTWSGMRWSSTATARCTSP
jgi:hypothetical protein